MNPLSIGGFLLWAARDVLRRPGDALMTGLCLGATTALLATAFLLSQAVSDTACRILSGSPAMVVRRVDAGGWKPIPAEAAAARIRTIAGVVSVRPRLWGAVAADRGPVTVVGAAAATDGTAAIRAPAAGEAVVGPGVTTDGSGRLSFPGVGRSFAVVGRLSPETAMVSHDLVLLNWADAGAVLGIAPGHASDLAVDVFHPQEAEVIAPELAKILPWPVAVTTRSEAAQAYSGAVLRRGSLAALAFFPSLLALLLLVIFTVRERVSRREEIGLLRSVGWSTADLVRLHLIRSALIGVPGVVAGMLVGYALVFWPGVCWPSSVLLGWTRPAPQLFFDPAGALQVMFGIGALMLLPYFAAAAGPILWAGLADPRDLLEKGR